MLGRGSCHRTEDPEISRVARHLPSAGSGRAGLCSKGDRQHSSSSSSASNGAAPGLEEGGLSVPPLCKGCRW